MDKRKQASEKVKDRLLSALIEFAGEKDWSKVTATELIKKAGVARASFYRNFKSVEEIMNYGLHRMSLRYHEGKTYQDEDFHSREMMLYKFRFYQENAKLVLAFHHARAAVTLLDVITDCEINALGDMPFNSISKYELYYVFQSVYYLHITSPCSLTLPPSGHFASNFLARLLP